MSPRGLSKDNLRWMLHSKICSDEKRYPKKICRDPRCQELKRIKEHVLSCRVGKSCPIPLCATTAECNEHWESCIDDRCFTCKDMKYAFQKRFIPDVENYPQPNQENFTLTLEDRTELIREIVENFYPDADLSDLQDEVLKTAIERARIIECQSYLGAETLSDYDDFTYCEIKKIMDVENL
nr:histone acetyltransferase p300 [Hymenolepis microstoma]